MKSIKKVFVIIFLGVLTSCSSLRYSSSAFNDDMAIKQKAVALIQKSYEPYSDHASDIDKLRADVLRAYEYEKTRKGNKATVAMWGQVINAKGNLFDYLDMWKAGNQLSPKMASESVTQVDKLLTNITEMETSKKKE